MKIQLPIRQAILDRRTFEPPGEGRANKVRLDFNENTAGCSLAVIRALRTIAPAQLAMYPEYEAASKKLARHFAVKPPELLLANGGDDALRTFFDAFVEHGSKILICEPTFPMYRYYAEIYGAHTDVLRYGSGMEFPLEETILTLRETPRVLFIANPNNPTGTLLEPAAIRSILEAATNTAVVIDEAYAEYSGVTVLPWIRKYPHLFVLRTFSKAAGLAALRLGAVMGCAQSIALLRRTLPPFPVNLVALIAAQASITDKTATRRHVQEVRRLRSWLEQQLQKAGVETYPSAGNFLLANFGPDGSKLFREVERKGILIRERKDIGAGFARMTIGTRNEMEKLLRVIRRHCRR